MKIYIDLLLLLNVWIDFFLLLFVKLVLRRASSLKRIILASITGGLTTFLVFIKISFIFITILKILLSGILVIIAFDYKNIIYTFKNILYLFIIGVIIGGIAYKIKLGVNNIHLYLMLLVLLTPIMIFIFYKQNKIIKKQYSLYYDVKIVFDNISTSLCGFLDSGNNLYDPITKKPIILVNKRCLKGINKIRSPMYVPIKTVNKSSLIKCYKPNKITINNQHYNNYLIGIVEEKIRIDGVDCLLNNRLMEDL